VNFLSRAWPYLAAVLGVALAVVGILVFLPRRRAVAAPPQAAAEAERRRVEDIGADLVEKDEELRGARTVGDLAEIGRGRGYR
tara:strand:+ start:548 stop:796 length:249 start_codon:yes stop_codon:yes gene_type:complete